MFIGHYPLDLKHGSQKIIKYTYNPKLHIKVPLKQRVVSIYLQAHFHKVAHVAQSRRESGVQKLIVRLQVTGSNATVGDRSLDAFTLVSCTSLNLHPYWSTTVHEQYKLEVAFTKEIMQGFSKICSSHKIYNWTYNFRYLSPLIGFFLLSFCSIHVK